MHEDRAPESVWTGQPAKRRWRRGPAAAKQLWSGGREKGNPGAPLGAWAVDGTLTVARLDGVRAYGRTG
ncbi:hypothetical protein ACIPC1_16185 [Streptomyces sp. NPDC087263]|uniref:hypothetical protein n=1 Tax=Streptomyces sp. NPDC087263 TaxID=3365773 RepID=UPI003823AA01